MIPPWSPSSKSFTHNVSSIPYTRPLQREGGPTPKIAVARTPSCRAYHEFLLTTLSSPPNVVPLSSWRSRWTVVLALNRCRVHARWHHPRPSVHTTDRSISRIPIPRRTKPRWHSRFTRYWWAFSLSYRSCRRTAHFHFTFIFTFISRPRRWFLREHPASRWRRQLTNCLERLLYYT